MNKVLTLATGILSIVHPGMKIRKSGEDVLEDFLRVLSAEARERRVVLLFREKERGTYAHRGGWEWMANPAWCARASELIVARDIPVRDWEFHPADSFGDWSFHAVSTYPVPRVATLPLDACL